MSERDSYNPGEFCWVDLASPDLDASKAFYGDLIGWDLMESPDPETYGNYGMFTQGGKVVAGLGPLMSEDQPPAWASYVCVDDLSETQKKVEAAGGQVMMGDIEIPGGVGSMAVCADSEGAVFCLWQPGETKGAQLVNEVGTWTWNQLSTRDLEGAKRFYGEVFGWTAEVSEEAPPEAPYLMWQVEGQRWEEGLAGVMTIGRRDAGRRPGALDGLSRRVRLRRGDREGERRRRADALRPAGDPRRQARGVHRPAGCGVLGDRAGLPRGALAPHRGLTSVR